MRHRTRDGVGKSDGGGGIAREIANDKGGTWAGDGKFELTRFGKRATFGGGEKIKVRQGRKFATQSIGQNSSESFDGKSLVDEFGNTYDGGEILAIAAHNGDVASFLLWYIPK